MKNGCTLCGGRVVGGICRECGWDNRKNDSKYRLNKHNANGVKMHSQDCNEHLNKNCDASAGSAGAQRVSRQRKTQIKERHQTGTAKKKRNPVFLVFKWIMLIALIEMVGSVLLVMFE